MLQPHIRDAVHAHGRRLDKLKRRHPGRPPPNQRFTRSQVPRPAEVREAAEPAAEGEEPVPEEDATFDCVCEAVEDVFIALDGGGC